MTARRLLALLLAGLGLAYALWLGRGPQPLAALLVFALPPLLLAAAALAGWRRAGFTASVLALAWFSHGVMRAWTDPPPALPAWTVLGLALAVIAVASGPAARARLRGRRRAG